MATLLGQFAHAPMVASATQNHAGSTYVHWVRESGPADLVGSYERNLQPPPGRYLVTVSVTGANVQVDTLQVVGGNLISIPEGAQTFTTLLTLEGTQNLRVIAPVFDQVVIVLHRL